MLATSEINYNIVERIKSLNLSGDCCLSDRIRTNQEIYSFTRQIMNLCDTPQVKTTYPNVDTCYANSTDEAVPLIEFYRENGYVFINYSKSNIKYSPYEEFEEDYDTHHVIGQEFDKVLLLMDNSFYYDENGLLNALSHPNPNYLYTKLFYQGITRAREKVAIIVVGAPKLMRKISSIFN